MIGIINNLNAKKNAKRSYTKEKLKKVIGDAGYVKDTRDFREMEETVEEFRKRKIKIFGISGGDGTVQRVVTTWIRKFGEETLPHIFLMAGGATNTIMNGIGQRIKSPLATLKDLVSSLKSNGIKSTNLHLLKVSYQGKNEYGASFANGILYKMEKKYFEDGKPGVYGVFKEVIEIIGGIFMRKEEYLQFIEPVDCIFQVDDKLVMEEIMASGVSVLSKPFPIVDPFHNLRGEGLYYLVSDLPFLTTLRYLPQIVMGRINSIRVKGKIGFLRGVAETIKMITSEGFTIDGELFDVKQRCEITLTRGPAVKFLIP